MIDRYRREEKRCDKVILVTHSMGGLVARYCSELALRPDKKSGFRDKIFGVVHGVLPAIGAAAVYRRFKAGTEGAYATSKVLGEHAAEMTAVLSSAPGPLQLLPTAEYGNGWLKIKDGAKEHSFPQHGDPYGEIYTVRGKWWTMCDDQLINPLNKETDAKRRQQQVDADWKAFDGLINKVVKPFHEDLRGKYHPITHAFIGNHSDNKAYGLVTWNGDGGSWARGARDADILEAKQLDARELRTTRSVAAKLDGKGWLTSEHQTYKVSDPDENGDGTVPQRSGLAPKGICKSFLQVNVASLRTRYRRATTTIAPAASPCVRSFRSHNTSPRRR